MRWKWLISVGLVVCLVLCFALPMCAPAPPAEEEEAPPTEQPVYHWRIQTGFAPAQNRDNVRPWLDEIEAMLGGRGTFDLYGSAEIVPDDETIPAIQAGTLDFCQGWAPGLSPPFGDLGMMQCIPPFGWQSSIEAYALWHEWGMKEIFVKAYEDLGHIHYVGMSVHDPMHVISTKPIRKYEDFDGLKINAAAMVAKPFVDAGAVTVVLPVEEFYMSAKTGIVDALIWAGSKESYTNNWHEVYPYFLANAIVGGCQTDWLANKEMWDSLPSDIQDIITYGFSSYCMRTLTYYYQGEPECWEYFTVTKLSPEDMAKIRESEMEYWDELGEKDPRCAEVAKILRDYNNFVETAGWYR